MRTFSLATGESEGVPAVPGSPKGVSEAMTGLAITGERHDHRRCQRAEKQFACDWLVAKTCKNAVCMRTINARAWGMPLAVNLV